LEQDFPPGTAVNVLEKPRILCLVSEVMHYQWVTLLPGSHKFINSMNEIDPSEWDAVITNRFLYATSEASSFGGSQWRDYANQIIPDHLMIFYVFPERQMAQRLNTLNIGPAVSQEDGGPSEILLRWNIPGREVKLASNLPESIKDIVKTSLIPVANGRSRQFGFYRTGSQTLAKSGLKSFRPFLYGPQDYVLAGSFEKLSGSSVWAIPNDLPNIAEWFDLALSEWHSINAKNFPGIGAWQTSSTWYTKDELSIENEILRTQKELENAEREFRARLDQLGAAKQDISDKATLGRKRLLWAQDTALQAAVLEALCDIGFIVEDMDPTWKEREFREDYRVRDPDEEDWMVIADATGVTTGAKGSKIAAVIGYVNKFVIEERPKSIPQIWLLINHLIERDPDSRGDLYRADDIAVLTSQKGLAISTAGLYVLVEACIGGDDKTRALRNWLRSSVGQITLEMARSWLVDNGWELSESL